MFFRLPKTPQNISYFSNILEEWSQRADRETKEEWEITNHPLVKEHPALVKEYISRFPENESLKRIREWIEMREKYEAWQAEMEAWRRYVRTTPKELMKEYEIWRKEYQALHH